MTPAAIISAAIVLVVSVSIALAAGYRKGLRSADPCPACAACPTCPACPACPECIQKPCPTCPVCIGDTSFSSVIKTAPGYQDDRLRNGDSSAQILHVIRFKKSSDLANMLEFLAQLVEIHPIITHFVIDPASDDPEGWSASIYLLSGTPTVVKGAAGSYIYLPERSLYK